MKRVYKYDIDVLDNFVLELPEDAQILTVQMQYGSPVIWALIDDDKPLKERKFRLAGTGHPIEENVKYIGTFQLMDGALVFHLFEVI